MRSCGIRLDPAAPGGLWRMLACTGSLLGSYIGRVAALTAHCHGWGSSEEAVAVVPVGGDRTRRDGRMAGAVS